MATVKGEVSMDYEKKYKEMKARVLEMGRGYVKGLDYSKPRQIAEYIDPELKESEDEKIRKGIIKYLEQSHFGEEPYSIDDDIVRDYITWLEKQGYKKSIWHNKDEEPRRGSLILLIMQSGTPIVAQIIEPNHTFNHGERWAYIDDLLEKQGEHANFLSKIQVGDKVTRNEDGVLVNLSQLKRVAKKQDKQDTLCYKCKKEQPSHSCQDITSLGRCALENQGEQKSIDNLTHQEAMDIAVAKCFNEQEPADKVEPKFHKDDWIVHQGTENIYQVIACVDNHYELKYGDNYTVQKCADVDRCARLWDITKDAKKGDVVSDGTTIFIFKDFQSDGSVMTYCDYDTDSGESDAFCPLSVNLMCSKITPATKEQRDALEKAMADAGYTFNFEKKELKKIIDEKQIKKNLQDNSFRRMFEHNPVWSEEDEEIKESIITGLEMLKDGASDKSLIALYNRKIDWLKSLKDKYTWKPSDEQMKVLVWCKPLFANPKSKGILESLISDLKKLRGE